MLKRGRRALSLLLALAMTLSTLSVTAFATETEDMDSPVTEEITEVVEDADADESTEGGEDAANMISSTEDDTTDGEEVPDVQDEAETPDVSEEEEAPADTTDGTAETPNASDGEEAPVADDSADDSADDAEEEQTDDGDSESELSVSDWDTFLSDLKVLEGYADSYVASNPDENAIALVINYIRTGVERYLSDSWETIAGAENTAFVTYVAEQDEANSTSASALRNLENFTIANGDTMDFGHLFGCLNVASNNSYNQNYVDFGSWLGDICDLLDCANCYGVEATAVEEMVTEITETYFLDNYLSHLTEDGVTSGFSSTDFRADMDCFYIVAQISGGASTLSSIFESYYTSDLTDASRAAYFLNNRFSGSTTQEAVRTSIYDTYSAHVLAQLLEADRDLTDVDDLRTACCYVLADYLFELADGLLDETEDPEEPGDEDTDDEDNAYYSVFSSTTTTLAPGVTQEINYALTVEDKQIVYYVATVDISRDDVAIYANYNDNDPSGGWAMSSVTSQMTAAEERHSDSSNEDTYIENYSAVVGVNGDFYNMSTGQPSGALVMEGVTYQSAKSENFFAILDDGTAVIGTSSEWDTYADRVQEAVGGSTLLVKDGEIAVSTSSSYYTSRASRTCVGITADGQVVLMVLDGRQEPFSAGGSAEEIAQIMIDAGCVIALNLDGGGSTTYAAKQEGSDEISVVNRPSDGYERSVSSSLVVVSTAYTSTEFDHALLTTDTDYLTIGSTLDVTVTGVSSTGNAAEIPEGAYLQVSDESIGSIDGNTFTALARGTVDIQLVVDGEVVGSKTLTVIRRPDTLTFTKSSINAIYGVAEELPLEATYENNPVTINVNDITFTFSTSTAGTMDGFSFIGDESSGVRKVTITAAVTTNLTIEASMVVNLYSSEERIFDFDNAMYGDESLAWNRDVSNAITLDNTTYYIIDTEQDTTASYTFAIDIQAIEAPERLAPLMTYLAGFAGTSGDATPWDYLLALAARVNTQTNVTISVEIAEGVDVDISGLSVVNDYFKLTSAEYDEETRILTVICNWVKQDGAIDPDTANSICVLSGITLTPSDDAVVDSNNCVTVSMSGTVSYDIYLRSSQLYSLASSTSNQEAYGIYPYYDPDDTAGYYGGHFSDEYTTFVDTFYVKQEALNGWVSVGDQLYYYVDNEYVTGVQYVPGYDDEDTSYYYNFGDSGICQGKMTGLFEYNNALYYAVSGVLKTGWQPVTNVNGDADYYYFDPKTGAAVDGEQTINGYDYIFTDCVLIRGDLVDTGNGLWYMWAGQWASQQWMTVDGNQYYFRSSYYAAVGVYAFNIDGKNVYYAFDENGVWQENVTGFFTYGGYTYLIEDGIVIQYPGLVEIDGDYYYFNSSNVMVKNCTYWITKTNGLMAEMSYTFDENGKMVNPPTTGSGDDDET
ncbi:MAG: phosphodiester glycosidase family protein, partial [Clostridiales bacterium]|nr:phosphodiester glycosidase family protein [Clostridiales bacterium]